MKTFLLLLVTCHLSLVTGLAQLTINLSGTIVYGGAVTPPAFVDAQSEYGIAVSSDTMSFTVPSGTGRVLLVATHNFIAGGPPRTVSSVTFNGDSLTNVTSRTFASDNSITLWSMVAPDVATGNIVVTYSGATDSCAMVASLWTGVHQTVPLGTAISADGSGTAVTVDVAAAVNDIVVEFSSFKGDPGTYTPHASQTLREFTESGGGFEEIGHSSEAGATTTTMSSTISPSSDWGTIGVALKPL